MECLDALSDEIDDVEDFDIADELEEVLKKLVASLVHKPKKLIEPIQHLVQAANLYQDALDSAADEAIDLLEEMTDGITSDEKTADLYDSKKDKVTTAQVTEACSKVETAAVFLEGFHAGIDEDKTKFASELSPNLLKIFAGLQNLITKYNNGNVNTGNVNTGDVNTGDVNTRNVNTANVNTGDVNIEEAMKEIELLKAIILSDTDTIESNIDASLAKLEARMRPKGAQCETFFSEFYNQIEELLEEKKKNWFFKIKSNESFQTSLKNIS